MDLLRNSLNCCLEKYPEFNDFFVALELAADERQTPGIRLDASKSLYEALVKTMLGHLDRSKSKMQLNRMTLVEASKKLFTEISRHNDDFNEDFVDKMVEIVKRFSIERNNTGDISHGHVAPKDNSTEHFVNLAAKYVESTCIYLLDEFMKIDLSYVLPEKYDAEENEEFNNVLDESHEPIGKILFSKALYELDYEAWIDERDSYTNV